jgi:hypothetical protein
MAMEPFASEQFHDSQFEQMVAHLCTQLAMYVTPATFVAVCAYLSGLDAARSGGPLMGLHKWLVVLANTGNNLHCPGLAWQQLPADPPTPICRTKSVPFGHWAGYSEPTLRTAELTGSPWYSTSMPGGSCGSPGIPGRCAVIVLRRLSL